MPNNAIELAKASGGCPVHGIGFLKYERNTPDVESNIRDKHALNKKVCYCCAKVFNNKDLDSDGHPFHDKRGYRICCYSFEVE